MCLVPIQRQSESNIKVEHGVDIMAYWLEVLKVMNKCSVVIYSLFVETRARFIYTVSHSWCSTTEHSNLGNLQCKFIYIEGPVTHQCYDAGFM